MAVELGFGMGKEVDVGKGGSDGWRKEKKEKLEEGADGVVEIEDMADLCGDASVCECWLLWNVSVFPYELGGSESRPSAGYYISFYYS